MSYNTKYNTRNSRYNTPGQFVSAGEQQQQQQQQQHQQQQQQQQPTQPPLPPQPPQSMFPQVPRNQNLQTIATSDVEMKTESLDTSQSVGGDSTNSRPYWMKSKLAGVKKLSNKERRRRQNENLRKLLTPKNALMVLNEMMPGEQLANVEPSGNFASNYFNKAPGNHNFCADLTVDGNTYKGYGENKLTARNAAAEQAIRDLIIKKMTRAVSVSAAAAAAGAEAAAQAALVGEEVESEEALPMIQLASFALHKLFSEWEYEGHKVPQLKPQQQTSESGTEGASANNSVSGGSIGPGRARPGAAKPPKEVPANAGAMHPCMLLTYMRPHLEYRELAVEGDRPQNMMFTLGVDVDGATYIGKASNKKEARKAAARSACQALFSVRFDEQPTANAPQQNK